MIIEIDSGSPVPPYEQIRSQVATMVSTGVLPVGHRLPPIRQLAADLELSNGTVARAYRELERDGWVETQGRKGTLVQEPPTGQHDHRAELEAAARRFATTVAQLGVAPDDARNAVESALDATTTTS